MAADDRFKRHREASPDFLPALARAQAKAGKTSPAGQAAGPQPSGHHLKLTGAA
jgi:hypothetical protein